MVLISNPWKIFLYGQTQGSLNEQRNRILDDFDKNASKPNSLRGLERP